MDEKEEFWIHPSSFTYRKDEPDRRMETVWVERRGWGFLKRKDLWVRRESTPDHMAAAGFEPRKPVSDPDVILCPVCGMYTCSLPGSILKKHLLDCGGNAEDWQKMEDSLINRERVRQHEERILAEIEREKEELIEKERRERFDRIREENLARQTQKDRKKRIREETKRKLRNR
jgi:hypothetical protein